MTHDVTADASPHPPTGTSSDSTTGAATPGTTSERARITITVNDRVHHLDVEPRTLLVDLLRDRLRLTGTHTSCEEGVCGACTVEVDGELVKSCLMFAVQADGASVTTVEGLASDGVLTTVQEAFRDCHAVQCGFCTPGMVVSATALLRSNPDPSEDQIRRHLVGNLCRCTGYQPIIAAVRAAAAAASPAGRSH